MADIEINGKIYKLSCTMSDCENGMHTFRSNKRLEKKGVEKGCCTACRSSFVNWERVHKRDISDFDYLKSAYKLEMIRNVFWSIKKPDEKMKKPFLQKSKGEVASGVRKRLVTTLHKPKNENDWDGRQTPFDGNLINWAQHATGTCCRTCLEYWHGIDANSDISAADYDYLEQLVMNYIDEKTKE